MQLPQRRYIAVLVLIPLIMASFNSNWLYSQIGFLDPWSNVGYFLHYGDPAFRPGTYKTDRLPWLLPGWVLYHVTSPIVANFVLHIGALLIATVYLYLTLARLVGRDLAFLAAVFLTVYFPFLGSGGWDYQNAGSGAYYALTLYSLTRAAQSERPAFGLFAAGVMFAATVHANILFINMSPVIAGHYAVVSSARRRLALRPMLQAAGWACAGFVALTLVLCIINWSVGREFLFFQPILVMIHSYLEDPHLQDRWWAPWSSGWIFWPTPTVASGIGVPYLAVPMATILVGCWLLLRTPLSAWRDSAVATPLFLIVQFMLLSILWIIWQSLGQTALEPDYLAYPLIIPCVLGLAGIMSISQRTVPASPRTWLLFACLLLAFIPAAGVLEHLLAPQALPTRERIASVQLFLLLAVLLVIALTQARRWPLLPLTMIAMFEIYYPPFASIDVIYQAGVPCEFNVDAFRTLIALDRFVRERARLERTWLWYGPQEMSPGPKGCRFNLFYLRVSATALSLNELGSETDTSVSQITDEDIAQLMPGDSVALVSADPSHATEAIERFSRAGRHVGPVQQTQEMIGGARLFLQLLPIAR